MKKSKFLIFIFFLFFQTFSKDVETSLQVTGEKIKKGFFDIGAMFKGMGTGFGVSPIGYIYSFEVWSDAHVPIYIELEGIASFMGAYFPSAKGYYNKTKLSSIFDAQGVMPKALYYNERYYFKMYISDDGTPHKDPIYEKSLTELGVQKNDPNIYYYHAYTKAYYEKGTLKHEPAVEIMGYKNPNQQKDNNPQATQGQLSFSSQLSTLNFYNSSGSDVQISLTFNNAPYTFTAEKYSYNILNVPPAQNKLTSKSDLQKDSNGTASIDSSALSSQSVVTQAMVEKPNITKSTATSVSVAATKASSENDTKPLFSLRPNTITFAEIDQATSAIQAPFRTLQLPAESFDGYPYTIEIFQDEGKSLQIGIQGLNPGNYNLPVTSRVRDVTPCQCTFWYQSLAQQDQAATKGYIDLPGQLWVAYAGGDSPVMSKVIPGQVVSWNLTRPLVSQQDQFVYFIYVVTTSDTIAKNFVQKVIANAIGKNIMNQYTAAMQTSYIPKKSSTQGLDISQDQDDQENLEISPEEQVQALMGSLQIANGVIEDTDQNVIGYLVGADVFEPKGLGFGRFYYTLAPSIMNFDNLVSLLSSCVDTTKGVSVTAVSLGQTVQSWFNTYLSNPTSVQSQVQSFLQQYANNKIVDSSGNLTTFGKAQLQSILTGSNSIQYPSMKLSTVTNQYVYDFGQAAPKNMPKNITQLNQKKLKQITKKVGSAVDATNPQIKNKLYSKDQIKSAETGQKIMDVATGKSTIWAAIGA